LQVAVQLQSYFKGALQSGENVDVAGGITFVHKNKGIRKI